MDLYQYQKDIVVRAQKTIKSEIEKEDISFSMRENQTTIIYQDDDKPIIESMGKYFYLEKVARSVEEANNFCTVNSDCGVIDQDRENSLFYVAKNDEIKKVKLKDFLVANKDWENFFARSGKQFNTSKLITDGEKSRVFLEQTVEVKADKLYGFDIYQQKSPLL